MACQVTVGSGSGMIWVVGSGIGKNQSGFSELLGGLFKTFSCKEWDGSEGRGRECGGVGEANKQINSCKKSAFSGQVKLLFSTPNNQEKIITR